MNQKHKTNVIPDFLKIQSTDGSTSKIDKQTDIANEMNRKFTQMGAKLAEKLDSTEAKFTDYLEFPNPNHERLILHQVPESEVNKLFQEIDTSKVFGIDDIPPKIVKWATQLLVPILTIIYNKCLVGGIYPDCLKVASSPVASVDSSAPARFLCQKQFFWLNIFKRCISIDFYRGGIFGPPKPPFLPYDVITYFYIFISRIFTVYGREMFLKCL